MMRPSIPVLAAAMLMAFPWACPAGPASSADLPLPEILREMDAHDRAMAASLTGYTCDRRYSLENRRFHKKAAMRVRMTYSSPGKKRFEVLGEEGSAILCKKVLRPMLAAEEEASREDVRPRTRIVEANYDFKLLGTEIQQGRAAYLLEVAPRTRNKFLIRGRVWVDAQNFGIMRVEAEPARSPSILIRNTHIVQQSTRFDDVWLPLYNHSDTDSLLFGRTDVSIDSSNYVIKGRAGSR
jgi:outer membrane lipoprotein-sorting protein